MEVEGDMDVLEGGREEREWGERGEGEENGRSLEPYSWNCFSNQSLLKQVSMYYKYGTTPATVTAFRPVLLLALPLLAML